MKTVMKKEVKKSVMAPDLLGRLQCFYLCSDGLYHFSGDESYAGFTPAELNDRFKDYRPTDNE